MLCVSSLPPIFRSKHYRVNIIALKSAAYMVPCLWVWNLPSRAHLHTAFGETSMTAEGAAPAKEQKRKEVIESRDGSSPCLTPEATVSSAIKCSIRWKLEAPSSSSLDATKAFLFPTRATGSGTGMTRSSRGNSNWTDSCQVGSSTYWLGARLNAFAFLVTCLDIFPEQGDRGKKKKKKRCFTWDFPIGEGCGCAINSFQESKHWARQDFLRNPIDTPMRHLACNIEKPVWHIVVFLSAINGQKLYIMQSHKCWQTFARMFTFIFHSPEKSICKDIP